ncbi:DUF1559 domain-containing protein [Stieleria sp. JC731]|uniref:DUF1559 domain-containing protein n=1 Tax=Pirellulaceae TaxID=2691357 RepID=UPI001E43B3E0|nr:DUF1559 domain-containing protein [Stieleria sp. JC731]MCC9600920.1 DUF1559 domain-containing protein [Stieleria sp. JC731]
MKGYFRQIDCIVLLAVGMALISILSMGTLRRRSTARAVDCQQNLSKLALASLNYHSAHRQYPTGAGGTTPGGKDPTKGNDLRLGAFVAMLPFYEHVDVYDKLTAPFEKDGVSFPVMGPVPSYDPAVYEPWSMRPSELVCPDDPYHDDMPMAISYVLNYGDAVYLAGDLCGYSTSDFQQITATLAAHRGVFARERVVRIRDVIDGTSNTLMFAEAKIEGPAVAKDIKQLPLNPSLALKRYPQSQLWPKGRDSLWCSGLLRSTGFQTILPPNSPSATSDLGEHTCVMSASSFHGSGVHVAFADGRIGFVSASVDVGDSTSPSVGIAKGPMAGAKLLRPGRGSPYGVWGAMGTRGSRESVSREAMQSFKELPTDQPAKTPTEPEPHQETSKPIPMTPPEAEKDPSGDREKQPVMLEPPVAPNPANTGPEDTVPSSTVKRPDSEPPVSVDDAASPTDPASVKLPPKTWKLAAEGKTVVGWLVSCDDAGNVSMRLPDGKTAEFVLTDFASKDAYQIVQNRKGNREAAIDSLRPRLVEAIALLEKKQFSDFLKRFYHPQPVSAEQTKEISDRVSRRRGVLIQVLDEAIRSIESGDIEMQATEKGFSVEFKANTQDNAPALLMTFLEGTWFVTGL